MNIERNCYENTFYWRCCWFRVRETLAKFLPKLKEKYRPTITIVNGENAAAGKGITGKFISEFLEMGVQAITMGNHVWRNKDIFEFIDDAKYLVRPANFPKKQSWSRNDFYKSKFL